jgi:uncharacterized SAM-binding protein YcdF (DUF218 family)
MGPHSFSVQPGSSYTMIAPSSNLRRQGTTHGSFLRRLLALVLLVATVWCVWVYQQIAAVAGQDNAQPADAIAVFGAAEYSGHPSPVLHGRDYLLANGIPFGSIIAETRSTDTEQQVHRLAAIAHENNLHHIVVVSDATHLFRIRELCKDAGLDVYTSPRPAVGHISNYDLAMRYFHEIVSYTALRLNLNVEWLHG